jgi:hypothetical protein
MENGFRYLTQSDITSVDTTQQNITADGRAFVYALLGGTSTVAPGTVLYQGTAASNSTGLAISTANTTVQLTGFNTTNTLIITNGSTAVTLNQFADGFLEVIQTSGTSNGPVSYRINGNTAAAASGAITVSLQDYLTNTSVLVAGTDTANLNYSPFANVIATTTGSVPVGVLRVQTVNTAAQANYAWIQTNGESIVNVDATSGGITLGASLYQSTTTAGSISKTAPTLANGTAYPLGIARATASASSTVSALLQLG